MKKLRKLVIDRSKWARFGRHEQINGSSSLLNEYGAMCCLGFDCHFLHKVPKSKMKNIGLPSDRDLRSTFTDDEIDYMVTVNDRTECTLSNITDKRQEKLIAAKFLEKGVEVTFVN